MKTVYFIRHAKSSWADPNLADSDRPLNKRGLRDAPFMARVIHKKDISPDLILSSPARRALTTAGFFARELGIEYNDIRVEPRIYEAFTSELTSIVQSLDDSLSTVFLFGHNPAFTSIANLFSPNYVDNVPTCGIVKIEGEIESWADFNDSTVLVTDFMYPKQFQK